MSYLMAAELTASRELDDFIQGTDVRSKWDAARRLMAVKQMQSAAATGEFRESFRTLGNIAKNSSGLDQLLAIALIVRISELVKGEIRKEAAELLTHSLSSAPEGFWTISETKNLPLEGKPSEIRENVAVALSHATGSWVIPYVIEALAREGSSRCRLELTRQLAAREPRFSRWLHMSILNAQSRLGVRFQNCRKNSPISNCLLHLLCEGRERCLARRYRACELLQEPGGVSARRE